MGRAPTHLALVGDAGQPLPEDPPLLSSAFRSYSAYVAGIAIRLLGRDEEVDDVVQDVFLEALRGLERLREPAAVKGWLATVTVRIASRRLRWRRLRGWIGLDRAAEAQLSLPAIQEHAVFVAQVYGVLDRLPVRERVAWTLRHIEGCSLEEVATHSLCSLATAKRRISAAHARIEEALRP